MFVAEEVGLGAAEAFALGGVAVEGVVGNAGKAGQSYK
jgi:hypothetical protein